MISIKELRIWLFENLNSFHFEAVYFWLDLNTAVVCKTTEIEGGYNYDLKIANPKNVTKLNDWDEGWTTAGLLKNNYCISAEEIDPTKGWDQAEHLARCIYSLYEFSTNSTPAA